MGQNKSPALQGFYPILMKRDNYLLRVWGECQFADRLWTFAADPCAFFKSIAIMPFAELSTFFADAYTKKRTTLYVGRITFYSVKSSHADEGTFINHFRDLLREGVLYFCKRYQKIFTIHPCVKACFCLVAWDGHKVILSCNVSGSPGNGTGEGSVLLNNVLRGGWVPEDKN